MTPRWRSRAFVRPLLFTAVGVAVSVGVYYAVLTFARGGPTDGPCTYGPDACGYVWMGAIGQALMALPALLMGLLVTGLVAGRSSRDARTAGLAVLIGVMVVPLVAVVVLGIPGLIAGGRVDAIIPNLAGGAFVGLILLVPVGLGFGVVRLVWPPR